MIAYESLNTKNVIPDAVCLEVLWPEADKPGLYVVARSEVAGLKKAAATVTTLLDIEAMSRARAGHWIGIKVAGANGVAAWGRAKIRLTD